MTKCTDLFEYLFVLGRDRELSILELESYFSCRKIEFKVKEKFKKLIVLLLPKLDFSKIINDLGGTIKIAEVCSDFNFKFAKNKINYGINYYDGNFDADELKQYFKEEKIRALRKFCSSAEIMPSDSLNLDLELIVFRKIYKVIAVYNPRKYKLRDETREHYDPLKVTSLRLAKIMINLSCVINGVIVDPFCGLGTILQEACLMGIKCAGLDSDKEVVEQCRKNLKNYKGWNVSLGNAREINKYFKNIDGIVTEPYMGPYLRKIPKKEDILKTVEELKAMNFEFLQGLSKVLTGRAVFIVPVFKTDKGNVSIGFDDMLKRFNFKTLQGFPYEYAPKGCKIKRLIYVFASCSS